MGVKFVTPKEGDAVAVVARSVEAKVEEELEEAAGESDPEAPADGEETVSPVAESENVEVDATIDGDDASE
jgi:DNA gyrase subunit A